MTIGANMLSNETVSSEIIQFNMSYSASVWSVNVTNVLLNDSEIFGYGSGIAVFDSAYPYITLTSGAYFSFMQEVNSTA